jgi:hypothetical protein
MLEKYQEVTKADVLAALKKHILPVFDSKLSMVTVVTAPSKADEIAAGLTGHGFKVEKRTLEVEADEDGSGSESGSDSESDSGR